MERKWGVKSTGGGSVSRAADTLTLTWTPTHRHTQTRSSSWEVRHRAGQSEADIISYRRSLRSVHCSQVGGEWISECDSPGGTFKNFDGKKIEKVQSKSEYLALAYLSQYYPSLCYTSHVFVLTQILLIQTFPPRRTTNSEAASGVFPFRMESSVVERIVMIRY